MLLCAKWPLFLVLIFQMINLGDLSMSKKQKTIIINSINDNLEFTSIQTNDLKQKGIPFDAYALRISNNSTTGIKMAERIEFKLKIYIHVPFYSKGVLSKMSKINAFYICMNCEISFYIKNSLYALTKDLPMFHQTEYSDVKYTFEFEKNFDNVYKTKLQSIANYIEMFVDNLNTIIKVELSLLSNETVVLQVLYKLKFKINSLLTMNRNKRIPDDVIVRQFFSVINALQTFIITNCDYKIPSNAAEAIDNKRLFSYFINLTQLDEKTTFLDAVNEIVLKNHCCEGKICSVDQMLLNSFVTENGSKVPSSVINTVNKAKIIMGESHSMIVEDTFDEVEDAFYDLEIVFFYTKSLLLTIMKIIHLKTSSFLLTHTHVDHNDKTTFTVLKSKMIPDIFPAELLNYFESLLFLIETENDTSVVISKISETFKEHLESVELLEFDVDVSLEQLIEILVENRDDFECFNELFTFLQKTFDKHYIPYIVDEKKRNYIRHFVRDDLDVFPLVSKSSNEKCKLIDGVFEMYVEIIGDINKTVSDNYRVLHKSKHIWEACKNIDTVKSYFVHTINQEEEDYDILKTAYNSLIILFNFKCSNVRYHVIDNYKRVVYLLMYELNAYGITHCSSSNDRLGYLLYNNLDMTNFGNRREVKDMIGNAIGVVPATLDTLPRNMYSHKFYFDLQDVHRIVSNRSRVFYTYKNIIKFYWKGDLKTFEEFHQHVTSGVIFNSQFLYSYYEIFFKFYLVAFFYHIDLVHNSLKTTEFQNYDEKKVVEFQNNVNDFLENVFPKTLQPFVVKLKNFAVSVIEPLNADYKSDKTLLFYHTEEIENESKRIKNQIKNWNFVIVIEDQPRTFNLPLNFELNHKRPEISMNILIGEVTRSVKNVLEKYLLLHKDNFYEIS